MEEEIAVAKIQAVQLPDLSTIEAGLKEIHAFQMKVRSLMIEGHDYGFIPGAEKPTLLKPGAEKLVKILNCRPEYQEIDKVEDWSKPFFYYKIKCRLIHLLSDQVVDEGYGSCNSLEARYRWRWVFSSELPPGTDKSVLVSKSFRDKRGQELKKYRIENEDIYSHVNTILKMAKKRALVDAALSLGRLSDIFTQDLEDGIVEIEPEITTTSNEHENKSVPAPEAQRKLIEKLVDKKLDGDWSLICKEYGWASKDEAIASLSLTQGNEIIQWLKSLKEKLKGE